MKFRGKSGKLDSLDNYDNASSEPTKSPNTSLFYQDSSDVEPSEPISQVTTPKSKLKKWLKIGGYSVGGFILCIILFVIVVSILSHGHNKKPVSPQQGLGSVAGGNSVSSAGEGNTTSSVGTAPTSAGQSTSNAVSTPPVSLGGSSSNTTVSNTGNATSSNANATSNSNSNSSSLFNSSKSEFIQYTNGYINLHLMYPREWVISEQTQTGFSSLKGYVGKGYFYLPDHALKGTVPVANFVSPKSSTVRVLLYPTSNSSAAKDKPIVSLISSTAKVFKAKGTTHKHIGSHTVTITDYTATDLGETFNCSQIVFGSGKNIMLFLLINSNPNSQSSDLSVVNEMIKTVNFSK